MLLGAASPLFFLASRRLLRFAHRAARVADFRLQSLLSAVSSQLFSSLIVRNHRVVLRHTLHSRFKFHVAALRLDSSAPSVPAQTASSAQMGALDAQQNTRS